jgi:multiple sugar transport system ATP-binding protein
MGAAEYVNVSKRFGSDTVIRDVSLSILDGELMVFVGPSGCGKSTLLRLLAGLEEVSDGSVRINDREVTHLPPKDRNVAMVFQNYALYPHMSVHQNIAFALKLKKTPRDEIEKRVAEAAGALGLGELLKRKPRQLSGGQRQRVAMGRAIVRHPDVFLMDEPLSNLDAKLRNQMRVEIKHLQRRLRTTMIYVTHDQVEAMTMADRIAIIEGGEIMQVGSPDEVYHRPTNIFVADFIGSPAMNFLPAKRSGRRTLALGEGLTLKLSEARAGHIGEDELTIGIRPEHIEFGPAADRLSDLGVTWESDVHLVESLGGECLLHLDLMGDPVRLKLQGERPCRRGDRVRLGFLSDNAHLFSQGTGSCISSAPAG